MTLQLIGHPHQLVRGQTVAAEAAPLARLDGVEKVYRTGRLEYRALGGIDIEIHPGELLAIVGPSGSGKSTILNLLTGIDRPTAGVITVAGDRIDNMTEEQLAGWRGRNVGIVFQFFQLLPMLTALENAVLPLEFARVGTGAERVARATANLELVGLGDRLDHLPMELSGGEQQRVAIARAIACNPQLLVADEPTGNLDTATAARTIELLTALSRNGTTVVYVTHDPALAARARRVVEIRDGLVTDAGGAS
jgi:putative ABC transport system ATP-binding protein